MTSTILHGNCLDVLKTLPDNSVHMAVTSPPYWGLRAYGTEGQVWPNPDGTPLCQGGCEWEHLQHVRNNDKTAGEKQRTNIGAIGRDEPIHTGSCSRCGAWRGELGHEPTPQLYVAHIVAIMREVRRVLRDDGTLWLNLGDSYMGGGGGNYNKTGVNNAGGQHLTNVRNRRDFIENSGVKAKDLVGIPWRVAFALQDDGWWLRQDIIWAKPNPMPESVTDRCTKAHEYMFLLAKSARYYYDAKAVAEDSVTTVHRNTLPTDEYKNGLKPSDVTGKPTNRGGKALAYAYPNGMSHRNRRSVWTITTKPFREAHFATFPPDLVEPCIKAGTSQHGVCATCGAPWERVMQRTDIVLASAKGSRFDTGKTGVNGNGRTQQGERHESVTADWRPTCTCHIGLSADDLEIIETPTGERAGDDPSLLTGRAGMNRPRGDNEGRRSITRYEQRMYAKQIKESPHRAAMQAESGDAFAHYTRTDKSGARPVPQTLLDDWISRGWIIRVSVPSAEPSPAVPATVLDPFNGAGTTGVVAKSLGRDYVGIELNPAYVEMAQRRIDKTQAPLL